MASLERILVPTDFSASSYAALGYAVFLANRLGAELVEVLHVVDPAGEIEFKSVAAESPQKYAQLLRSNAVEPMTRFLSDIPGANGLRVSPRIEVGVPADVMLAIAKTEGFSLIVMGTHGRAGIERELLGSVAEKVVRSAICPVLTVRVPSVARSSAAAKPPGTARSHPAR